jgi:hypothetical protein
LVPVLPYLFVTEDWGAVVTVAAPVGSRCSAPVQS